MLSSDQLSSGRLRDLGGKGNLWPGPIERALALARRPLDRAFERWAAALPALASLGRDVAGAPAMRTRDARRPGQRGPRVLVVSLRGWPVHNAYESTIAQALRLRGAEVAMLTCGGGQPACELGWARRAHPRPCDRCAWLTDRVARATGIEHYRLAGQLPWGADARSAPTGAGALDPARRDASRVSASWLLRATQPQLVAGAERIVADFALAADGVQAAAAAVLDEFAPDAVFMLNGLFAAERAIRELAIGRGMRAPTYEIAPRGGALVLSQRSPAPDYDVDMLWRQARGRPLSESQRADTVALLEDRAHGIGAHESYYERVQDDPAHLRFGLGLRPNQRIVSLFTNVTWDSATLGHDVSFASMFDWLEQAVRLFDQCAPAGERALVIRVHPAERRWETRERVQDVLLSRVGELPVNVCVVPAEEPLSSYVLLDASELVLTYTTTVGLEAAARGRRVAVAADTHYRGRGFTYDIGEREQLARVLAQPPPAPSGEEVELALRYAHMFFFRAMIPFGPVQTHSGKVTGLARRAAELQPGADPYLDWVCARILDGGEFGLPDELACAAPVPGSERVQAPAYERA